MSFFEIIKKKGFNEIWKYSCTYPKQNAGSKEQVRILFNKPNVRFHFIKGNKESKESYFYFQDKSNNHFSSMVLGGLSNYYIKDNNFDNPIIWGMNQINFPPCLIYPRPFIKGYMEINDIKMLVDQNYDALVMRCFEKENHLDIFNAMFDNSILFDYSK